MFLPEALVWFPWNFPLNPLGLGSPCVSSGMRSSDCHVLGILMFGFLSVWHGKELTSPDLQRKTGQFRSQYLVFLKLKGQSYRANSGSPVVTETDKSRREETAMGTPPALPYGCQAPWEWWDAIINPGPLSGRCYWIQAAQKAKSHRILY